MAQKSQILNRLKKFMEMKGLNNNQVTIKAGLSNGQIGKAFKRNQGLNHDTIEKLLHAFPDLDRNWFLTGSSNVRMDVRSEVRTEPDLKIHEPEALYGLAKEKIIELESEVERLKAANNALLEAFSRISEGKSGGASDVAGKGQKSA